MTGWNAGGGNGKKEKKKNVSHITVWVEKKQTLAGRWLTGGVGAPSLTSLRPAENSPQSQNLQGDFRQYSLSLSVSLFALSLI